MIEEFCYNLCLLCFQKGITPVSYFDNHSLCDDCTKIYANEEKEVICIYCESKVMIISSLAPSPRTEAESLSMKIPDKPLIQFTLDIDSHHAQHQNPSSYHISSPENKHLHVLDSLPLMSEFQPSPTIKNTKLGKYFLSSYIKCINKVLNQETYNLTPKCIRPLSLSSIAKARAFNIIKEENDELSKF